MDVQSQLYCIRAYQGNTPQDKSLCVSLALSDPFHKADRLICNTTPPSPPLLVPRCFSAVEYSTLPVLYKEAVSVTKVAKCEALIIHFIKMEDCSLQKQLC